MWTTMEGWPRQRASLPFCWHWTDGCPLLLTFLSLFQLLELAPIPITHLQVTGDCFAWGLKLHRRRRDGVQLSLTSTLSLSLLLSPEMGLISRTPGICFISHMISQGTSGTISLVHLWTTPKHGMVQSKRFRPTLERAKPKWWGGNRSGEKKAGSSLKLLEEKKHGWSRQASTKCVPGMITPPTTNASCPGPWATTPAAPHAFPCGSQWPRH